MTMHLTLILIFGLVLLGGSSAKVQYCGRKTPLETEFVDTTYEETRPVQGCVSTERHSQNGYQVVVIRANTTSSEVLLTLTDQSAEGEIIVLDAPSAIKWRLSFFGPESNSLQRHVVLSPGSKISQSNVEVHVLKDDYKTMNLNPKMSDEKFGSLVRQHYGGLTIMAQVSKANRVSLSTATSDRVPSKCSLDSLTAITDFVVAFSVLSRPKFGCYHSDLMGTNPTDVHIIDLTLSDLAGGGSSASSKSIESSAVFLSMTSKQEEVPKNLTIILKSSRPVTWYLESYKTTGYLRVISNNGQVENHSLSAGQNLQIERKPLPDDFEDLWRVVIGETNVQPVSYIGVENANVISMVLPAQRSLAEVSPPAAGHQKMTSNFVPDRASLHDAPISDGNNMFSDILNKESMQKGGQKVKQLEEDLKVLLGKQCDQSATIVTLPITSMAKFNVTSMTLKESSCRARKNQTHWILETLSTSCGSLNSFKGNHPIMMNEIHLKFAEGSEFHGLPVTVPFTCKYPPGFQGFPINTDDYDYDYDYDDEEPDTTESSSEMYGMKILRKKKRSKRPEVLVSKPNDRATVSVGDQLKVQTVFASQTVLSLMIEECWVSDHPGADKHSVPSHHRLIEEGCSVSKNVTMFPTPLGTQPAFVFEVTNEHRRMSQIYLFCIIGLCSPVESLTTGNLGMCVDPTIQCDSEEWHIGPAAQQISRRGPLFVTDRRLNVEIDTADFAGLTNIVAPPPPEPASSESPSLRSAHVVMVGVPAEIAVAISIASFLIGAALTGMLCCIHHRKALPKSARNRPEDTGREGDELVSMLAPSSNVAVPQQHPSSKLDVNA